ncbi:hypothetical protein PV10_02581 [Exophiala mesophila]|uniref:Uncharacterized protein n=1 Tax=Exophiala mesophila TaxID=212818 RepID=A0A0D1ZJQ1_EXOME|nr:uncharacterized protein PV10_02581 [Exophiala mesophila]KIV94857.1 hypothetical protein PV10_02581 [Exophiala mesophila]
MISLLDVLHSKGLCLALVAVLGWILICLKRLFFSPLRNVPGPVYAKVTHLWLKKQVLSGRRLHYIHDLHKKYGPIVQIGPNEIDVSDPQMFKDVHRIGGGFLKDPWYQSFRQGDFHDVFSMIDPKEHAERRRLFAPLWTNSALHKNWEPAVIEKVKLAVANIRRDALTGEADVFKWWTFMTTDVISHLSFGESLDILKQQSRNRYIDDVEQAAKLGGIFSELPFLRYVVKFVPLRSVQDAIGADHRVSQYGHVAVVNAKSRSLSKENVFSKILAESEKDGSTMSEAEVAFEASGFIVAGSGTTAVSLTYLVWAALSHPDVQSTLETEVAKLPPDADDSLLQELPFLNAVVDETLRLYGAAPGSLPRTCPPGGFQLGGHFIPEGTTVSSQAYTLHRNEDVYHNAEKFNPSRFLDANGNFVPAKSAYAPFGAGSRTCLGVHLARMELRHGAVEFFRECRGARLAASMRPQDMDMLNFFLISPKGFVPITESRLWLLYTTKFTGSYVKDKDL